MSRQLAAEHQECWCWRETARSCNFPRCGQNMAESTVRLETSRITSAKEISQGKYCVPVGMKAEIKDPRPTGPQDDLDSVG